MLHQISSRNELSWTLNIYSSSFGPGVSRTKLERLAFLPYVLFLFFWFAFIGGTYVRFFFCVYPYIRLVVGIIIMRKGLKNTKPTSQDAKEPKFKEPRVCIFWDGYVSWYELLIYHPLKNQILWWCAPPSVRPHTGPAVNRRLARVGDVLISPLRALYTNAAQVGYFDAAEKQTTF